MLLVGFGYYLYHLFIITSNALSKFSSFVRIQSVLYADIAKTLLLFADNIVSIESSTSPPV